jgi:hypothetical protein
MFYDGFAKSPSLVFCIQIGLLATCAVARRNLPSW